MNRVVVVTLAAAFVATGCKGDDTDVIDTDVIDTDDTDVAVEPDVSFANADASADAWVSLTWVDVRTFDTRPVVGDVLAAAPFVDGEAGFVLDDPSADALIEVDPVNLPGLKMAFYIPTTHLDEDGDGLHNGEPIVGVGSNWLVWMSAAPPPDLAAAGFVAGWNAMLAPVDDTSDPVATGHIGVPLPENLRVAESLTLGGDVAFEFSAAHRLAAVSVNEDIDTALVDLSLTDPWSMTLAGRPPVAWLSELGEGVPLLGAVAFPIAYEDVDGSGGFSDGDGWMGNACVFDETGGHSVVALWLDPPTDVIAAVYLSVAGFGHPGWNAFGIGDDGPVPIPGSLTAISLTGACGIR